MKNNFCSDFVLFLLSSALLDQCLFVSEPYPCRFQPGYGHLISMSQYAVQSLIQVGVCSFVTAVLLDKIPTAKIFHVIYAEI